MIRWFARNDIAANLLMAAILIAGVWSALERLPLEVQPTFRLQQVRIHVDYRGGSPPDVERAVIIPIERALEGLAGVRDIESTAGNGRGEVVVNAKPRVDTKELKDEIQTRIDAITSFPDEIEPPRLEIPDSGKWFDVIKVAISGQMDERDLLRAARRVRDDLMEMPGISQAAIQGHSAFEIGIEADPMRLRDFGLTFGDLAEAVRRSSLDLPAGQIQTDEGNLVIRSKGQAYVKEDFEKIVIRNRDGAEVRLGDVARVGDGFEENRKLVRFEGEPALLVEVLRLDNENALDIANKVKGYVASAQTHFPEGIQLHIWDDSSIELEGRLGTLLTNLAQGSILVLVFIGIFLRPSIAFWVLFRVPVCFAGCLLVLPWFGMTMNVMTVFGLIIALGLVIDDAVVTSENVFTKLRTGMDPVDAAVTGTKEVAIPVTFGVITTVTAFLPLLAFEGFYGTFTRQIPPVVGAVLVFSLLESKLSLPGHLKWIKPERGANNRFIRFQQKISDTFEAAVFRWFKPFLVLATKHRYTTLAIFLAFGLVWVGVFQSGRMGFVSMPSLDRNKIIAAVTLPRDTPIEVTHARVRQIAAAAEKLRKELIDPGTGKPIIEAVLTSTGGWSGWPNVDPRQGFVSMQITDPGQRSTPGPRNVEISKRLTEAVGKLPDVQSFWVSGDRGGGFKGGGDLESLEVELRGPASEERDALAESIESLVEQYSGIAGAWSDLGRLRDELRITIRPEGEALGLTQRDLARQVRAAFYGEEAQRVQRGRDDIRVMVRLPREQRQSLHTLQQLRIRTPDGGQAPFQTVADARFEKTRAEIRRVDGAQIVTIAAKPVDETVDVVELARDIAPRLDALLAKHPELSWRFDGYVAEHEETNKRFWVTGLILLFTLYTLLAIPFRSLVQPLVVMTAIPFGIIGALLGHFVLGITPSYLSLFGLLALAGIMVNNALVMIDFINQARQSGGDIFQAVIDSGTRRFRPIMLTSVATFVDLLPSIFDRSLQGQFLVPMAVALAFGSLFGTAITLCMIPSAYLAIHDFLGLFRKAWNWYRTPFTSPTTDRTGP